MVSDERVSALVAAWQRADLENVVSASDRDSVMDTETVRSLVVERTLSVAPAHEAFTAWLRYGRLLAERRATTALVGSTVDSLARSLPELARPEAARAALLEGYEAVVIERERRAADEAWSARRCVVKLGKDAAAVCLPPFEDPEKIGNWATDVTRALERLGVRRVFCEGSGAAHDELAAALATCGIAVERCPADARFGGVPRKPGFWPFR